MHRMIAHAEPLPTCAAGHTARHIHDQRRRPVGGHLVECACRQTSKHDCYEQALAAWCALNGTPVPRQAQVADIFDFRRPVFAASSRARASE